MMLYSELPKEYSGGLIGLNIFSGSLGMLAISKLSVVLNDHFSKSSVYGLGALLVLFYLILYLIYIYTKSLTFYSTRVRRPVKT